MPESLRPDPFAAVREALSSERTSRRGEQGITVDTDRRRRTGDPEIVYGLAKRPEQVAEALALLVAANGRAVATRCSAETMAAVPALMADGRGLVLDLDRSTGIIVASQHGVTVPPAVGLVGVLAAGSSDRHVVAEIETVLRESGIGHRSRLDVGVAGLHRLVAPLSDLIAEGADAIIVVAGMDGALPSVVTGLVDVPVIGVPTSTGYGFGGDGTGALMAMLQGCAPGLMVVNIDNGVGAALAAARIVRGRHPAT